MFIKTYSFCSQMHTDSFVHRTFLFAFIFEFLAAKNCDRKAKFSTWEFGQFFCVYSLGFFTSLGMKLKNHFVITTYLKCEESNAELGF